MPAILRSEADNQIMEFSDPLNPQDFSTLRLKIDQKIIQGRRYFVFDLSQIDFKQTRSLPPILALIDFCLTRQTSPSVICPDKKIWKKIISTTGQKIEYFISLTDCLEYIATLSGPVEKKDKLDPRKEELKKLIAEFKKKATPKNYDPLGLVTRASQYKTNPNKDCLKALEAAIAHYKKLKIENEETNHEVTQLAEQMMALTLLRKKAIRAEEIQLRKNELLILIRLAEIEEEMLRINN